MTQSTETPTPQDQGDTSGPVEINMAHAYSMRITNKKIEGHIIPIPIGLWWCIIGFHREVSIKMRGESVSYHRFHAKTGEYHTIIPYQKTSRGGLSVNTNWKDGRNVALLDKYGEIFGEEFFPACSIHTHVDIAAFESGTDAKDEEFYAGWHITLGNLISHKEYDMDFRIRLPKIKKIRELTSVEDAYSLSWENFFSEGTDKKEVFENPGTINWLKFVTERVT